MSARYAISSATVVMLVVLRLCVGWHFFSEGVKHYTDPHWTSAPVLRAATGPLAPMFRGYLPDAHGMDAWLHADGSQKPSSAVQGFVDEVQQDLADDGREISAFYELSPDQQKKAAKVLGDYQAKVRSWANAHKDELEAHVHAWRRADASSAAPDAEDVPFRKQRLAQAQAALAGESAAWKAEIAGLEDDYRNAVSELLTAEQNERGAMPRPATSIGRVDAVMTYAILVIGGLLLLGLFTRTACVAGALFLLSVVMTQPFWVSEAQPTFNQFVEMFALVTLATTQVGRWGGLDFFVHNVIFGRGDATKGTSNVSES